MIFSGWQKTSEESPWVKISEVDDSRRVFDDFVKRQHKKCEDGWFAHNSNSILMAIMKCDLNGGSFYDPGYGADLLIDSICFGELGMKSPYISHFSLKDEFRSCVLDGDENDFTYTNVAAQVAKISWMNMEYLYMSMTTFAFWKPIGVYLEKKFGDRNLGGNFLKIGAFDKIDNMFKDVIGKKS